MLDVRHSRHGIVNTPVRSSAELCVKFLQPLAQLAEKVGPPSVLVLEGQTETLYELTATTAPALRMGLFEQTVLSRGFPGEPDGAGGSIRYAPFVRPPLPDALSELIRRALSVAPASVST